MSSILQGTLASEERLRWLERAARPPTVRSTIAAAAEALGVSEMTIRRDLVELEDRGTARRVRAAAPRAVGPAAVRRPPQRAGRARRRASRPSSPTSSRPGRRRLRRVVDDHAARERAAARARDLTVLTNGPDTFAALQGLPGVTPLLTGGRLEPAHRQPRRPARVPGRGAVHGADALRVGRGRRPATAARSRRRSRRRR